MFTIIAAVDSNDGIGRNGTIPWNLPHDMLHFRRTTMNSIVIMGHSTYNSLPCKLNGRTICVIGHNIQTSSDINTFSTPWECVRWVQSNRFVKIDNTIITRKAFVCGGASIYNWFESQNLVSYRYITHIHANYNCDVFYKSSLKWRTISEVNVVSKTPYFNIIYDQCINHDETALLQLISDVYNNGYVSNNRTNTPTRSLFGRQLSFTLRNNTFPLMTTRRIFIRGVFEELMLYLRGQTDSTILEAKHVNIWRGNTSRSFLDSRDLKYKTGDMGHTYGFSFRHFGAKYTGCNANYDGAGYDQLTHLINNIKTNPNSRRHIISLWEPNHMHNASLPPCLYQWQFNVNDDRLSCMMTQRSSDIVTAGGWNVVTGALFTIMLAHVCDLKPDRLIWNIGNVHIYDNLRAATAIQLGRCALPYPKLFLKNPPNDITKFEYKNMEIINYNPYKRIKITMNV